LTIIYASPRNGKSHERAVECHALEPSHVLDHDDDDFGKNVNY